MSLFNKKKAPTLQPSVQVSEEPEPNEQAYTEEIEAPQKKAKANPYVTEPELYVEEDNVPGENILNPYITQKREAPRQAVRGPEPLPQKSQPKNEGVIKAVDIDLSNGMFTTIIISNYSLGDVGSKFTDE